MTYRDTWGTQCDTQLAACVDCPPLNKGTSSIPTAPHIFFCLPESRVDLSSLESLQHTQPTAPEPKKYPDNIQLQKVATNNKCWQGCGEKGTLVHCWWECRLVQPLWKTVWNFLKKLKMELPFDPAIPL